MKNIFLTLFVSFFLIEGYAQAQNKIDSLEAILKNDLPDSTRLKVLLELSKQTQYVDFAKSRHYTDESLLVAEKLDDKALKVLAYQSKALMLTSSGDYSAAIKYDNMSLENDIVLKDTTMIARDYNNIGNDYYDLGEYDDAFFYFTQSHRLAVAVKDTFRMLVAKHNIGRVFKELGQYEIALENLNLAKKMSEQQEDREGIPYAYDEIGDVQLRKQEYDSALRTLGRALKLSRQLNVNFLEPKIHSKLATAYLGKEDFERARAHYDSAYTLSNVTNDRFGVAAIELGRGIVYTKEGRYNEALTKIENSLSVAKELNARVLEIKCFNQLSTLWEMKGDFKKSLYYYRQYKQLEDTLFSQEMQGKLLRDQLRFETESRDSRIAFLSELQVMQQGDSTAARSRAGSARGCGRRRRRRR